MEGMERGLAQIWRIDAGLRNLAAHRYSSLSLIRGDLPNLRSSAFHSFSQTSKRRLEVEYFFAYNFTPDLRKLER
jgi:hypothetical protein